jgi:hypothetical protein
MEKIIILLMQSRTLVHTYHLKAKNLAPHLALDELYNALTDHIDDLTEVYQGFAERLLDLNSYPGFTVDDDPLGQVREIASAIESMRNQITPNCSTIQNMIDEALQTLYKTKYKLMFLPI